MYFLLGLVLLGLGQAEALLNAKAWQSLQEYQVASDFPETEILQPENRPNTAIGFTGGGSRAYVAALGHLAGLRDLGLLKNVKYIGGISGGAWATMSYVYAQSTTDDETLLGPILPPDQITADNLYTMDPLCLRANAAPNLTAIGLKAWAAGLVDSAADAWAYGIAKTYLEPANIPTGKYFSWNDNTVKDIVGRNKGLSKSDFLVPKGPKPFPVIGSTLVGPAAGVPYNSKNQNYTLLELTPLFVGQLKNQDVTYLYKPLNVPHKRHIGGAIESFAFSLEGKAPVLGLASDKSSDILTVPSPTKKLDLSHALCASSYAPGSFFNSLSPKNLSNLGMHVDYWSPSLIWPTSEDTYLADGGAFENIPLIPFLQRKVDRIVLFFTASMPLQPSDKYDPYTDPLTTSSITDTLPAYFGLIPPESGFENRSFEYEMNQVFRSEDYAVVVSALQAAQAKGTGIVAKFNLTTVENKWRGIPAGFQVQIIFSYLGRLKEWENQLSADMQALLVPKEDVDDLSHDVEDGPYKNFPHYATKGGDIPFNQANVLADLTGWQVVQNADLFRDLLQG